MKTALYIFMAGLVSVGTYANVGVQFEFKSQEGGKTISLSQNILTDFDKVKTISIPDSDKIIEMTISEDIPEEVRNPDIILGEVHFNIKVYQKLKGEKKLISSPEVITILGKEALLEMFSKSDDKKPITSIKLIPTIL